MKNLCFSILIIANKMFVIKFIVLYSEKAFKLRKEGSLHVM